LFKSLLVCAFGYTLSVIRQVKPGCVVVGSNYGGRPDPNAVKMIEYLLGRNENVVVIGAKLGCDDACMVPRGSLRAAHYYFCSKACFYTHSFSDIIPYGHLFAWLIRFNRDVMLVFMQHGVIGLKSASSNRVSMKRYVNSLEKTFDLMLVSSEKEKAIIAGFNVDERKLAVTGLPRFDGYFGPTVVEKTVLIFFTWQNITVLSEKINGLLNSSGIQLLREAGYEIVYRSHDMQKNTMATEECSEESFQAAIETCQLLITDESSLAWDIFYRRQDVIFYKPEETWLSSERYLLDRVSRDLFEFDSLVNEFLNGDSFAPVVFAAFMDDQNCARVAKYAGLT